MSNEYWKQALETARKEREKLVSERNELDAKRAVIEDRIVQLEQAINSLSTLAGETETIETFYAKKLSDVFTSLRITDACREILKSTGTYVTPVGMRELLLDQGYDLSGYTNVLASIHSVLKRLVDSGEVVHASGPGGSTLYRWDYSGAKEFMEAATQGDDTKNAEMNSLIRAAAKGKRRGLSAEEIEYASERRKQHDEGFTDKVIEEIYAKRKKR